MKKYRKLMETFKRLAGFRGKSVEDIKENDWKLPKDIEELRKSKKVPFKRLLKKHLGDFAERQGFRIHRSSMLIQITNRIIQGISFQPSMYIRNQRRPWIFIQPLFVPEDTIGVVYFGETLGYVMGKGDVWYDLKDEKSIEKAFNEIRCALENHASPWFAMTRSSDEILDSVRKYPEHPCFKPHLVDGSSAYRCLGYIALDAGRFDEAKEYFQKYLDILQGVDSSLIFEGDIKRKEEVNRLLSLLDNPEKIRQILDENTRKTAEALKLKLEE